MAIISVIVPVYQVEPYLRRCVDSILAQTFSDFELILVDDGSPDRCGEICDEYAAQDSRIRVIHQENGGLSAARNAGIDWVMANSESQWLSFVDSDDWIDVRYLELLYVALTAHGADAAACLYTRVNDAGDPLDPMALQQNTELFSYDRYFSVTGMGVTPYVATAKLFPRKCFAALRFPLGKLNEDLFTTHKLLGGCQTVVRVNTALYFYFQSATSIMRSSWNPRRLDEVEASEQLISFMRKKGCKAAKSTAVWRMMYVLETQLAQLNRSSPEMQSRYRKKLLRKGRKNLLLHGRILPFYCNWKLYCRFFPFLSTIRRPS